MTQSDTDPVQVPRWAFRLAGGTILMGMVAFFTTVVLLASWMALLTWGLASFANESKADRKALRSDITKLTESAKKIEKSTSAVEDVVSPVPPPAPRD